MRDILERAYHLIDDKRRWTQFQYARDSLEGRVDSKDPAAVCWCAAGAIIAQPGYSRALLGVVNGMLLRALCGAAEANARAIERAAVALKPPLSMVSFGGE